MCHSYKYTTGPLFDFILKYWQCNRNVNSKYSMKMVVKWLLWSRRDQIFKISNGLMKELIKPRTQRSRHNISYYLFGFFFSNSRYDWILNHWRFYVIFISHNYANLTCSQTLSYLRHWWTLFNFICIIITEKDTGKCKYNFFSRYILQNNVCLIL